MLFSLGWLEEALPLMRALPPEDADAYRQVPLAVMESPPVIASRWRSFSPTALIPRFRDLRGNAIAR